MSSDDHRLEDRSGGVLDLLHRVRKNIGAFYVGRIHPYVSPIFRWSKSHPWITRLVVYPVLALLIYQGVAYGLFLRLYYGQPHPEFWQSQIIAYEELDREAPPEHGKVLFVGSSSIRFWDTLEEDMAPLDVLERGFGGANLSHVTYFANRIVLPYKPRAIVLYAGDNDFIGPQPKSAQEVFDNYVEFVSYVHDYQPEVSIYYIAIKPSTSRWHKWPEMQHTNQLIEEYAEANGTLHYLDIAAPMMGGDGQPRGDLFRPDGLHLNAIGYSIWTQAIKPILMADLGADVRDNQQDAAREISKTLSYFIEMPEDGLALTHGQQGVELKPFPKGIQVLEGTEIENTLALTVRLRNQSRELVGLASELEYFPEVLDEDGKQVWDTYWTLMVSGKGSLFLYEKESLGPKIAKVFFETQQGDEDWQGRLTEPTNVGPLSTGHGVIAGGTGEFSGASGSFEEIGTLTAFTTSGELTASIELRLHLDPTN